MLWQYLAAEMLIGMCYDRSSHVKYFVIEGWSVCLLQGPVATQQRHRRQTWTQGRRREVQIGRSIWGNHCHETVIIAGRVS